MSRMFRWFTPVLALGLAIALTHVGHAEDAKTGSISGTVTGADGKAVSGAKVRVMKPMMHEAPPAAETKAKGDKAGKKGEAVAETNTDNDGKFKLENIPAGEYQVAAAVKGV